MRILVNYHPSDQNYLPILQYHLRQRNMQAIATNLSLTLGELINKAKHANCAAILIANQDTLIHCVNNSKATLDLYRGSVLRFSVPAIVCNSLSHTHTVEHGSWLLGKDLDKFKTVHQAIAEEDKFSFQVLETYHQFDEAFKVLSSAAAISHDIETKTVLEDEDACQAGETIITCCSWTAISHEGKLKTYVLPLVDFLEDHWKTDKEYVEAILFMRKVNALPIPKVMHNGMYDAFHCIRYHAEPLHWSLDTMALAHSEFSSLPKSLDFVASITLPDYMQWSQDAEEASKNKNIMQYWGYNGKDTWYTARILLHYLRALPAYARKNYGKQFPLVYPALYANFEGIKVDAEERQMLRDKAEAQLATALDSLRKLLGDPDFNPGSPQQVKFYIYDLLGAADPKIGLKKDAKTGKRTRMQRGTNEKNLRAVGEQHPILLRVTNAILDYREARKAISTYFDFLRYNGRLYWGLNPFGTDSGRMSCSSSPLWCGTQVQNIPGYAKGQLVADDDYILVELDNSQSEARCTAYLARETNLIRALEDPTKDFYTSLGTLFFSIPYENVTKDFRNGILKKIVHGTNYMMGAATFIENAGVHNILKGADALGVKVSLEKTPPAGTISIKQFGNDLLESYHKPFPRVREWYRETAATISATHMLVSPLGHTRYFFGDVLKNHNLLRSAIAHAPQNLSVSILNIGLMKVWDLVKQSKGLIRLKAQIHDSIFLQIHKSMFDEAVPTILTLMDNRVMIYGRSLSIPVEYKYGPSWGNMTEVKAKKG